MHCDLRQMMEEFNNEVTSDHPVGSLSCFLRAAVEGNDQRQMHIFTVNMFSSSWLSDTVECRTGTDATTALLMEWSHIILCPSFISLPESHTHDLCPPLDFWLDFFWGNDW